MIRTLYILLLAGSSFIIALIASEIYFVVTNSNRPDFFEEGPSQNEIDIAFSMLICSIFVKVFIEALDNS